MASKARGIQKAVRDEKHRKGALRDPGRAAYSAANARLRRDAKAGKATYKHVLWGDV